ncbi:MAG: hypothetical protein ABSG44_21920 [Thermodesulfobacteriota bacterium]|jgi:DNA-binding transcriptional regulator WhiA
MDELDRREDIRHFIASNGLDTSILDERSDLEVYRQRGESIADFFRSIESRFVSLEYRLSRLEGERYGHQKD